MRKILTAIAAIAICLALLPGPAYAAGYTRVYNATGAAAVAMAMNPGSNCRIVMVTIKFSAAPTTSESITFTLNSNEGAAYDTVLYTRDPSTSAATSIVWIPDDRGVELVFGDTFDIAYTNTDTRTYGVQIYYELLP